MTATTLIQTISRETGHPVAAVETAAIIVAPMFVTTRTDFCPKIESKFRQLIEARLQNNKAPLERGQERK